VSRRRRPAGVRISSLSGIGLRSLRARPLRSLLTAGAVVLGVGMVFGVLLLVGTIHATFDHLYDATYGKTDLVVSGVNSVGSLPESTIDRIRAVDGVDAASGDIFSIFRTLDERGRVDRAMTAQLYVVGVDYRQPDMTTAVRVAGRKPVAGRPEVELDRDWAAAHDVGVGDRVRFSTPSGIVPLRVVGLFTFAGGLDLGGYGTGSMPVDVARRIMDKPGVWDEIMLTTSRGTSVESLRARLKSTLGPGVEVSTPKTKSQEMQDQFATLDILLYFFSGIALFVGGFLIFNSFGMTLLQRTREIGTLRALGAGSLRVTRSILVEALVLALVGSLLGLVLGGGLAVLLARAVRTFGMPVAHVELSPRAATAAVVVGVLATLAGAAWPAVRAARVPPVRALFGGESPRKAFGLRRALVGIAVFAPATALAGRSWFGPGSDSQFAGIVGMVATMAMFVGMVLLAPFVILPLVQLLARPLRRVMPAEGRLAADAAQTSPGRTAATAATLLIALSVVVVNATVAESFVGSVKSELDRSLGRDLTVQPLGYQQYGPPQGGISRQLRERIAAFPETGALAVRRSIYLSELPAGGSDGVAVAYDPQQYDRVDKVDYEGAPRAAVVRGLAAGGVAPAKTYAKDRGLEVGDTVRLEGPSGIRTARVVGLVDTFDAAGNAIYMSLPTMAAVYGVRSDSQLVVKARSPSARVALERRVDALLERRYPGLEALSNAELKRSTTAAINQQFAFFNAIVYIAVLVGILGIVNTLTMSVLERTREIGVLRALGASRWRVRRTMADESLLISLAGSLAGAAVGLLIAVFWVLGMRETRFPALALHLPVGMLVTIVVLGVVAGVVAAILPARRAARLEPLAALRYE